MNRDVSKKGAKRRRKDTCCQGEYAPNRGYHFVSPSPPLSLKELPSPVPETLHFCGNSYYGCARFAPEVALDKGKRGKRKVLLTPIYPLSGHLEISSGLVATMPFVR